MDQILLGFIFALIISTAAWFLKSLNLSGMIAATIMGTITFGLGGWPATFVLLFFFISSSLLSKLIRRNKTSTSEKYSKGSQRDAVQVLANGGVGTLLVIVHYFFPDISWVWPAYVASFAAVTADTWATELGVLSHHPPILITNGKIVEPGTSGGITLTGTLSSFIGSLLIGTSGIILWPGLIELGPAIIALTIISLAGLIGSLVDSLIGATIQGIYTCPKCKKETEQHPYHTCGSKTYLHRGKKWFNNDLVNVVSAIASLIIVVIFYNLI